MRVARVIASERKGFAAGASSVEPDPPFRGRTNPLIGAQDAPMNSSTPTAGTSVFAAIYLANSGLTRSEKALDAETEETANGGGSVESIVDEAIQPEVFAATARVVKSADETAQSTF